MWSIQKQPKKKHEFVIDSISAKSIHTHPVSGNIVTGVEVDICLRYMGDVKSCPYIRSDQTFKMNKLLRHLEKGKISILWT